MRRVIVFGIVALIVIIPVVLITSGVLKRPPSSAPAVSLTYWTVFDDTADLQSLIEAYQARRPYVSIKVQKIPEDQYEQRLLQAWALDQGPDIFSLPNTWVRKYVDFIKPLPASVRVYQYTTKKVFFRDQTEVKPITIQTLTHSQLRQRYVDVVTSDVVLPQSKRAPASTYALPLSVDTLVLYYNRDLLNAAGIAQPAATWKEITEHAPLLTILDSQNNILQSAIAMGTAANVNRATDIWSLLAIQNGTTMIAADGSKVAFNDATNQFGVRALEFYTDFADFAKEVYAWNADQPEALDAFTQGKVGYFIGYRYHQPLIEQAAPTLNFAVAPAPHINADGTDAQLSSSGLPTPVTFASYWVETVAQKSAHADEAWDFVQFASSETPVKSYLEKTGKTSALRSVLNAQRADPEKALFADQALIARSWYHGTDAVAVENYLKEMIDSVADNTASAISAINLAAEQVNNTLVVAP